MPATAPAPRTPTKMNAARQPERSPIRVPSGMPNAKATVRPPVTTVSASPRLSGGARSAAPAAAVGVKTAAPQAAITLEAMSGPKVGRTSAATFAAANTTSDQTSSVLRGTPLVSVTNTGEPTA